MTFLTRAFATAFASLVAGFVFKKITERRSATGDYPAA
jgi:hypothetical protein